MSKCKSCEFYDITTQSCSIPILGSDQFILTNLELPDPLCNKAKRYGGLDPLDFM